MTNLPSIYMFIIAIIASVPAGVFTGWGAINYYKEETVFQKGLVKSLKKETGKYLLALFLNLITFLLLTYFKGNIFNVEGKILVPKLIEYLKYICVTPLLLIVFLVDAEYKVIPNRVFISVLEIGILFSVLAGVYNIHLFTDALIGMAIAFVTFTVIALIGGIVAGKEAMGLGDLKFITPIGLFMGLYGTINLIICAFVISAIFSLFIVIIRAIKKEPEKYIAFGPFIVIAFYITICLPQNYALGLFMLLSDKIGTYITKISDK